MSNKNHYYFLHIAKTAGTSFRQVIESNFTEDTIAPVYLTHELAALIRSGKGETLQEYALTRGHMGYTPVRYLGTPLHIITMLRDPIERTISHYEHIIRHPDHWLYKELPDPKLSLEEFLAFPPARALVTNFQTRNIVEEFDLSKPIVGKEGKEIEVNMGRLLSEVPPVLEEKAMLDKAKERLSTFAFVGVTEQFAESITSMAARFDWNIPDTVPLLNSAPKDRMQKEALSQSTRAMIEECTVLDRELYAFAKSLYQKRFKKTSAFLSCGGLISKMKSWVIKRH